jgi:hypothetical protein
MGKLKNTMNQLDLTDIYKTLHPTTAKYIFFSNASTKIYHILGNKTYFNDFKIIITLIRKYAFKPNKIQNTIDWVA